MLSRTKTTATSAPQAGAAPAGRPSGPVVPPRVTARRRRPGLIALSVALIAGGGLGGAVLWMNSGQRTDVITVTRHVPVGQTVTDQDLGTVSMTLDPGVRTVRTTDRESVVGKRAAVELQPGSLLSASQVTASVLVNGGEQVVPLGLKPEQVPATELTPGTKVAVVAVPGGEQQGKQPEAVRTIAARVVKVGDPAPGTGSRVVDVAASRDEAAPLAAWASTGNVRLVLDNAPGGS
ncbi:SAF domain-containing protein [Streptomyces luteireticuli]|uniref:SAF domain-containing protein n=1 Tax=Streptomyces luteireticuli TaxID=173858 RepID=UPI00355899EC